MDSTCVSEKQRNALESHLREMPQRFHVLLHCRSWKKALRRPAHASLKPRSELSSCPFCDVKKEQITIIIITIVIIMIILRGREVRAPNSCRTPILVGPPVLLWEAPVSSEPQKQRGSGQCLDPY